MGRRPLQVLSCAIAVWKTHSEVGVGTSWGQHGKEWQTLGGLELVCNEAVRYIGEGDCAPTIQRNQADDANVGRCPLQVLSCVVVV